MNLLLNIYSKLSHLVIESLSFSALPPGQIPTSDSLSITLPPTPPQYTYKYTAVNLTAYLDPQDMPFIVCRKEI